MENCLFCKEKLTHVPGRKQKSFCDVNCRNKHFYAERKKLITAALAEAGKNKKVNPTVSSENDETNVADVIPKNLIELKGLCPHKDGTDERRTWIATERQKYGI